MVESPSCPPVVVPGWGGAGEACASAADAGDIVAEMQRQLGAAFPQHWRSVAADGFEERLTELLIGCGHLLDVVEQVHRLARQFAEDVALAHPESS